MSGKTYSACNAAEIAGINSVRSATSSAAVRVEALDKLMYVAAASVNERADVGNENKANTPAPDAADYVCRAEPGK
jgi:hypothetical protein